MLPAFALSILWSEGLFFLVHQHKHLTDSAHQRTPEITAASRSQPDSLSSPSQLHRRQLRPWLVSDMGANEWARAHAVDLVSAVGLR